jgi:NifB/MoaA-like Fe-S oxidoreductase
MDQMPPGMRPSLSYKDDDIRYSFDQGTYVTLDRHQAMEAAERRFSPVHVSVHCTDPDLRGFILGRGAPAPILPQLSFLAERHIEIQTQIVVMPGINDGRILETTLEDLYRTGSVTQTGVVPVGLTRYREGLHPLRRPRPDEAHAVVRMCEGFNGLAIAERGGGWCWAADEFYTVAGLPIPATDSYEGCTLQANGIGLLAGLMESCRDRRFEGGGTIVTGSLAAPFIRELLAGSGYTVLEVRNQFFGPDVGVAGLLTGADVVRTACEAGTPGGPLFLPSVMFSHEGLTLDDLTADELSGSTGHDVHVEDSIHLLP